MEKEGQLNSDASSTFGPTPLGNIDHRRFSGFAAELVFGKREDGSLVHISKVESGLACACRCPACDAPLIARKGKIVTAHFAHASDGEGCGTGAETNAHIWAKEVLEREKFILLPDVVAAASGLVDTVHRARLFRFAKAKLEHHLGNIVPDVLLETESGQQLLVEVRVTHACGEDKIAKIAAREIATVEVDLSALRTSNDREKVESALLRNADRIWLYNRKILERRASLEEEAKMRAIAAEERERNRKAAAAEKARQIFDSAIDALVRAHRAPFNPANAIGYEEAAKLEADGRTNLFLPGIKAAGFLVPEKQWQAIVIDRVLGLGYDDMAIDPRFTPKMLVRALETVIARPFLRDIPGDVAKAFRDKSGAAHLPEAAVEELLEHLCDEEILTFERSHYSYSYSYARKVSRDRAKRSEIEHRQRRIDRAMNRILFATRADPYGDFKIDDWQAREIPPLGLTLDALIEDEGENWQKFDAAITAIEVMIEGGKPVRETLGLPLGAAIARAVAAEKRANAIGADDRIERLRARAENYLGADADIWLQTRDDAGTSPMDEARESEATLQVALGKLSDASRLRVVRLRVEAEQRKLSDAAEKALGSRTASFFLDNLDPKLGMPPRKYCTDATSRARCMSVLDEWIARDKRNRRR